MKSIFYYCFGFLALFVVLSCGQKVESSQNKKDEPRHSPTEKPLQKDASGSGQNNRDVVAPSSPSQRAPQAPLNGAPTEEYIIGLFALQKGAITASASAKKIKKENPASDIIFNEKNILAYDDKKGEFTVQFVEYIGQMLTELWWMTMQAI